jgi:hypothetical protein
MHKLLVFVVAAVASGIFASTAAANHSWGGYHWARTSNPFTIQVGDNVSAAWDGYLRTAASDWSADTAGNPLNASVVAGASKGKCRAVSGRVEVCNGAYGNNGWLGLAQIWITSGGHITRGTSKMNDTYFNTSKYNTPAWRGGVMCQEIGHTWGLDHQDESGADFHTCMDYATNPDADNMHPNLHDYQELAIIYTHLDATTTIGRAASSSARVVRIDHPNRSVIERRFADGSRQVTFIIWAR